MPKKLVLLIGLTLLVVFYNIALASNYKDDLGPLPTNAPDEDDPVLWMTRTPSPTDVIEPYPIETVEPYPAPESLPLICKAERVIKDISFPEICR